MYTDGGYLKNNPTWGAEDSEWKAGRIMDMLERNGVRPSTVCEVGCGAGEILNQMRKRMPDTVFSGYEVSPQAYEFCMQRAGEGLEFHLGDLIREEDAYFDLVMCIDVMEHIEDYFGFLRGLRAKGDYKLFHIPLDMSVQSVLRNTPILNQRKLVGHIHYFNKETATATLRDTGYEIIDWFYTAGSVELPRPIQRMPGKIVRKALFRLNKDFTVRLLGGYSLMVLAR